MRSNCLNISTSSRVSFSFRDNENLNTEKDYYNDLPGKLPPELLQNNELPTKVSQLTIQVWQRLYLLIVGQVIYLICSLIHLQKPRERLNSNLIDLNSPPPDHDYVNDKTFDVDGNMTPPAITRDVFDMRK